MRKNKNIEREFAKIFSEINKQDFQSVDELRLFLDKFNGKNIDDLPIGHSNKEKAQDLIYQAYECSISEGKKLIKKALLLDPDNADAYNYLADKEKNLNKSLTLYSKALKAGKKTIGEHEFKMNEGHFWGIFETRPYMRAKAGLANCYYCLGKLGKAMEIYQEMLTLNPGDNQGVRYLLAPLLLQESRYEDYKKLYKEYYDDAASGWGFNYAIYQFMLEGKSKKSEKALLKAWKLNKFIIDFLLGSKLMPKELPEYMGFGDENEAVLYTYETSFLWESTPGALNWLSDFRQNRMRLN